MTTEGRGWFKLFPAEFLAGDSVYLSNEEFGVLMRLLFHNWIAITLPQKPSKLAQLVGLNPKEFEIIWDNISQFFEKVEGRPGRITNPYLATYEERRAVLALLKSKAGKMSAEARKTNTRSTPVKPAVEQEDEHSFNRVEESRREITATATPTGPLEKDNKKAETAAKTPQPANGSKSNSKAKRKKPSPTPPPDGFKPSQASVEWLRGKFGVIPKHLIDNQTEQFLLRSKAKGSVFVDWDRAWQTWMNNWKTDFGKNPPKPNNGNNPEEKKSWNKHGNPNLVPDDDSKEIHES